MLPAALLTFSIALGAPGVVASPPFFLPVTCSRWDRPIVAEVFYDATGDDTGHEFVELFNVGGTACSLEGLRLEAGDGAGPGRWTLKWTGGPSDSIAVDARFVIGGTLVDPPPQATAPLDLQNGPDAVRLVWPDGVIEVVGYGAHANPEYFCAEPAPDAPSGQSLARVPDRSNQGSNALDFQMRPPSPGRENLSERDAELIPGSLVLEPEQPEPERGARLTGSVANRGAQALQPGEIIVIGSAAREGPALFSASVQAALAPGEVAAFALDTGPLAPGRLTLHVRISVAGDAAAANDRDSLRVRVGPGPLEITEIQFHPGSAEGEWVEVRNRDSAPIDPAGITLADRGAARGVPNTGSGAVEPESLVVLAQDRLGLLARFPALDPDRVWAVSPWPALNNSNDSTGVADAVVLRDADGTPCDRVEYSAAGVPAGVPLERRSGGWWPSRAALGTPLSPPLTLPAIATRFQILPRRVRAGTGTTVLAWSLPWERARVSIEVYDLAGRRVMRPLSEMFSAARGEREWGAGSLAPGLYLVALLARAENGDQVLRETVPLRIEGGAP